MSPAGFGTEPFRSERLARGRLFSDELEEDPWVLFHGTSANNIPSIETRGFTFEKHPLQLEGLRLLVEVFETMNWVGSDMGGFAVLKTFSSSDFNGDAASSVFLAEFGVRALRFATGEFAGGEKLRAVRRAYRDLERYRDDTELRAKHKARCEKEVATLQSMGAAPSMIDAARPRIFDLDWLDARLQVLKELSASALEPAVNFTGGAVYAVRVNEGDLPILQNRSPMGIAALSTLSAARITSKMKIPSSFEYNDFAIASDMKLLLRRNSAGVAAALSGRNR